MRIYLMGAEQPTNARLLKEAGAVGVGLSFHSLIKRLPKRSEWLVAERIHAEAEMYLSSGGYSMGPKLSEAGVEDYIHKFTTFVERNALDLCLVTEYDGYLSPAARTEHRATMQGILGDKFATVWDPTTGRSGLQVLASTYKTVGLPAAEVRDSPVLAASLVPLRNSMGTKFHALDGARPDDLSTGRFDSAATTGWLSPMKNGETIVWDGTRMVRYQKKMQDQARRRHRGTFRQAGFNADLILEGDYQEITRFTVWSYMRLEASVTRKPPSKNPFSVVPDDGNDDLSTPQVRNQAGNDLDAPPTIVDSSPLVVRNEAAAPVARTERKVLPVVGLGVTQSIEFDENNNQVTVSRPLLQKGTVPIRQCDTCHIAANCPGFVAAAECVYDLPLEIKTREQKAAVRQAFLEMQAERVAFMRFQEELSGGYADPNLSQELDRYFRMESEQKKIEDDSITIRQTSEIRAGQGVLSRLFGEKAVERVVESQAIESGNIVDGDIV